MRIGESLRAKTVAVTAFSLVSAGLLGVAAILIARQLGPSGRGEFAASYSLAFLLVILGSLGAGPAGRRLLSIGNAAGGVSLDVYQSLSARLVLAQLGVASVGALVLLPVFGAADSTADRIAFVACCVGTLTSLLAREGLFGVGRGELAALILACGCGATLAGVVFVGVVERPTVGHYLWVYAIAGVGESTAATVVGRRSLARSNATRTGRQVSIVSAGRAVIVMLFAQTVLSKGDRLVIGAIARSEELGEYAVAVSVMELLSMGSIALGNVALQGLANGSLTQHSMRRARNATVAATAAAALVLGAMAPVLIRVAFGSRFEGAIPAMRVLALAAVPFGSMQIDLQHLIAIARARSAAVLSGAAAASMVALDVPMVERWGILGAAWTSVIVYTAAAVATRRVVDSPTRMSS